MPLQVDNTAMHMSLSSAMGCGLPNKTCAEPTLHLHLLDASTSILSHHVHLENVNLTARFKACKAGLHCCVPYF